jgi:hypothetical protein
MALLHNTKIIIDTIQVKTQTLESRHVQLSLLPEMYLIF